MEYRIFDIARKKLKLPFFLRAIFGFFFIILGIIGLIAPILPGLIFILIGIIFVIPGKFVKHIIKIRKNITYAISNFRDYNIIKQKYYDLLNYLKKIKNKK